MKNKIFFTMAFLVLVFFQANAQSKRCHSERGIDPEWFPDPTLSVKNGTKKHYANVSYDVSTTMLAVNFPTNSSGGTVEVLSNGIKVLCMDVVGGTTFCCMLYDYGIGDYYVIVSVENSVFYSKSIIVDK